MDPEAHDTQPNHSSQLRSNHHFASAPASSAATAVPDLLSHSPSAEAPAVSLSAVPCQGDRLSPQDDSVQQVLTRSHSQDTGASSQTPSGSRLVSVVSLGADSLSHYRKAVGENDSTDNWRRRFVLTALSKSSAKEASRGRKGGNSKNDA